METREKCNLTRYNGNLKRRPAVHLIQSGLVVVQLENICHHTLHVNLAAVKICHRTGEAESLRERADDLRVLLERHRREQKWDNVTLISSPNICTKRTRQRQ